MKAKLEKTIKRDYISLLKGFRSNLAELTREYALTQECIQKTSGELNEACNSNDESLIRGYTSILNNFEAEAEGLKNEFEVYKKQYLELLRDVEGTISEITLDDYTV